MLIFVTCIKVISGVLNDTQMCIINEPFEGLSALWSPLAGWVFFQKFVVTWLPEGSLPWTEHLPLDLHTLFPQDLCQYCLSIIPASPKLYIFMKVGNQNFVCISHFPYVYVLQGFFTVHMSHLKSHYLLFSKIKMFFNSEMFIEGNIWTQQNRSSRLEQIT